MTLPVAALHAFIPPIVITVLIFVAIAFIVFKLVKVFAVIIALAIIVFVAWQLGLFEAIGLGMALPGLLAA